MARETFQRHLDELRRALAQMGDMVDRAIDRSTQALQERDLALARLVIADDRQINEQRFAIEERSVLLIATQAPMASDLRVLASGLNIITDLERMADHAAGNAKITLMLAGEPAIQAGVDFRRMAEVTRAMLRGSLAAFMARDVPAAEAIAHRDDEVDALYDQTYRILLTYMLADPTSVDQATRLLWAAHNLERIGDRVTNICERVLFLVTGKMVELTGTDRRMAAETLRPAFVPASGPNGWHAPA